MKSKDRNNFSPEDLIDIIPKNLRYAISYGIDGAQDSYLRVYAVIVDRFSSKLDHSKECYDDDKHIWLRANLSKNTVQAALSWLLSRGFLRAEHRVIVYGPQGSTQKIFPSNTEALAFIKQTRSKGSHVKDRPQRVLLPPHKKPTLEDLGLILKDKNNSLFKVWDSSEIESKEAKHSREQDQTLNSEGVKFEQGENKEWGTKLDYPNETFFNEMETNQMDMDGMEKMVTINKPSTTSGENKKVTVDDLLVPFTKGDLKNNSSPEFDPNFAMSLIVLRTLHTSAFVGAANLSLRRSICSEVVPRVVIGHFLYAAIKFNGFEKWPDWFVDLSHNFSDEIEHLDVEGLRNLSKELSLS